ncbi:MAG: hypothetical protein PVG06_18615 [Desulfobacterales bacterium]
MTSGDSAAALLDQLQKKARMQTAQDWQRTIRWEVDDQAFFWKVSGGTIQLSEPADPDIILQCSVQTLKDITLGKLPFFIAIWVTGDLNCEGSFADAFKLGYLFLTDRRARRIVFLTHCFLNTNTRFPGGCAFEGATVPLVQTLLESGVGIIQMPCPEFLCLGLEKELYGELSENDLRACFRKIGLTVIHQVEAYLNDGYDILGIIGMNPSPSCGVEVTKGKGTMLGLDRDTSEKEGSGVFIEELQKLARERQLNDLPFFGVRRLMPGEEGLEERLATVRNRLKK